MISLLRNFQFPGITSCVELFSYPIDWMIKPNNWEPHDGCLSTAGVNSHKTKTPNAQPEVQSEATIPSTEHCGPSPEQAVWPWESQKLNQTKEPTTVRSVIVQCQSICQ